MLIWKHRGGNNEKQKEKERGNLIMKDEKTIIPTQGWKKDTLRFQKESNERDKSKYYCKCGHSVIIPYNKDKKMCSWCKHWIIKKEIDERRYFRDKMRQMLNRKEK